MDNKDYQKIIDTYTSAKSDLDQALSNGYIKKTTNGKYKLTDKGKETYSQQQNAKSTEQHKFVGINAGMVIAGFCTIFVMLNFEYTFDHIDSIVSIAIALIAIFGYIGGYVGKHFGD